MQIHRMFLLSFIHSLMRSARDLMKSVKYIFFKRHLGAAVQRSVHINEIISIHVFFASFYIL